MQYMPTAEINLKGLWQSLCPAEFRSFGNLKVRVQTQVIVLSPTNQLLVEVGATAQQQVFKIDPNVYSGGGANYFHASQAISSDGNYIYALDATDAQLSGFTVSSGILTPVTLTFPASCAGTTWVLSTLAIDPTGRFLYIACNNGATTSIIPNQINGGGTITPGAILTSVNYSQNTQMAFDSTGTYLQIHFLLHPRGQPARWKF
jgi:hypothetical protein